MSDDVGTDDHDPTPEDHHEADPGSVAEADARSVAEPEPDDEDASGGDDPHPVRPGRASRLAPIGLVVLAVAILAGAYAVRDDGPPRSTTLEASPADGGTKEEAPREAWPDAVGGRPQALGVRGSVATEVEVAPGTAPGIYIWNDYDGWHLWTVGGPELPAVTGSIEADDVIGKADLAVPGRGTVAKEGKVAELSLPAGSGLAGVDFNPGMFATSLTIVLDGPTGPIPPKLIHLGSRAEPAPTPLTLSFGPLS